MIRLLKVENRLVLTIGNKSKKTAYIVTPSPRDYMGIVFRSMEEIEEVYEAVKKLGIVVDQITTPDSPLKAPPCRPYDTHALYDLLENTELPMLNVDEFRPGDGNKILGILGGLGYSVMIAHDKVDVLYENVKNINWKEW